jgi:transcriptional regulator GlxA family with amidase domain
VSRRPAIGGYRKGSDAERIAKAQELARRNLDGRVSVRELARELGIGREAAARIARLAGVARDSSD